MAKIYLIKCGEKIIKAYTVASLAVQYYRHVTKETDNGLRFLPENEIRNIHKLTLSSYTISDTLGLDTKITDIAHAGAGDPCVHYELCKIWEKKE